MYCILVAGMPASGKSTFAAWLSREKHLPCMSKDQIKELLFDTVGFRSRQEKVALEPLRRKSCMHLHKPTLRQGCRLSWKITLRIPPGKGWSPCWKSTAVFPSRFCLTAI